MSLDLDSMADVIAMIVNDAVAPLKAELALTQAKLAALSGLDGSVTDLRERVVVAETKAGWTAAVDLSPVLERLTRLEVKADTLVDAATVGALAQRVEAVEAAEPAPLAVSPADVNGLRDRLVAVETKSAALESRLSEPNPLAGVLERTDRQVVELSKDLGLVRERLAVAEVRQGVPGPAGQDGKDGVDGIGFDDVRVVQGEDERTFTFVGERDGRVKQFGAVTVPVDIYRGVWSEAQGYVKGDCVTWGGSEWHANEPTTTKPGDGTKAWTLKVKRGRDGKDGKDAGTLPVVSVGHGGR